MSGAVGTLRKGLQIGETVHKDFELREGTAADMFAAELEADPSRGISYAAAMCCQQLVRIGTYKGPFTLAVLGKLSKPDYMRINVKRQELDAEGEEEQPG